MDKIPLFLSHINLCNGIRRQRLILEVNEDYYDEKPEFKKLTLLFLGGNAAFAAAKKGEVAIGEIPLSYFNEKINNMKMIALDSIRCKRDFSPNVLKY